MTEPQIDISDETDDGDLGEDAAGEPDEEGCGPTEDDDGPPV